MLEAAYRAERSPRELSFTAALQKIMAAWAVLSNCDAAQLQRQVDVLLRDIGNNIVGNRPHRVEPRKVKRRPKRHKLLKEPREVAQAKLLRGEKEDKS